MPVASMVAATMPISGAHTASGVFVLAGQSVCCPPASAAADASLVPNEGSTQFCTFRSPLGIFVLRSMLASFLLHTYLLHDLRLHVHRCL